MGARRNHSSFYINIASYNSSSCLLTLLFHILVRQCLFVYIFKTYGKIKNYLICLIALLFLLVGCLSKILYGYNVAQDERKRDSYKFEKEATQAGFDSRRIFNLCMISKVYIFREK